MQETLNLWRKTDFIWGQTDCLLSVADYIVKNGGKDGGALYRGTYHDEVGANKIIRAVGGFEALIDATGIEPTENPVEGDVCVCVLLHEPHAGIHTSDGVVFRHHKRGVVEISKRFIKITQSWSIKSCRP